MLFVMPSTTFDFFLDCRFFSSFGLLGIAIDGLTDLTRRFGFSCRVPEEGGKEAAGKDKSDKTVVLLFRLCHFPFNLARFDGRELRKNVEGVQLETQLPVSSF